MTPGLADIAAQAESRATPTARESRLHGPRHWRDVARIAARLQPQTFGADAKSLFLFAAVHDTQRHSDDYDPEHGNRAAAVLEAEIDHGLDERELGRLLYAMRHHSGSGPERHDNPTIGACWDADRLTLHRVGFVPERRYMSTAPVRKDLKSWHRVAVEITDGPDLSWREIEAEFDSLGRTVGRPRLAASNFYGYLRPSRCGLRVWLREQGEEEDPPGVFAEMLMRLGIEHEQRHLARFPRAIDIAELPREEQLEATRREVVAGNWVIYQGRMEATTAGGRSTS